MNLPNIYSFLKLFIFIKFLCFTIPYYTFCPKKYYVFWQNYPIKTNSGNLPPFKFKTLKSNVRHLDVESNRMCVEYFRRVRFCSTLKYRIFLDLLFASIFDVIYNIFKNFSTLNLYSKKNLKKFFIRGNFFKFKKIWKVWCIGKSVEYSTERFDVLGNPSKLVRNLRKGILKKDVKKTIKNFFEL